MWNCGTIGLWDSGILGQRDIGTVRLRIVDLWGLWDCGIWDMGYRDIRIMGLWDNGIVGQRSSWIVGQ